MSKRSVERSICVFCGAREGTLSAYKSGAHAVGDALASQQISLIYGGGGTGLMGAVADAVIRANGHSVGVIPEKLVERELAHKGISELHVVPDMHQRKAQMAAMSGAFIAMPGGIGTMEELFEAVTWRQLGYQNKPVGLFNVNGYYDELIAFLNKAVEHGFLDRETRSSLVISDNAQDLVTQLAHEAFATS